MIYGTDMPINKGDDVAVTVTKEWAEAVGAISPIHYLSREETTAARVFIAKLVSATEPNGLWIKSAIAAPPGEDDTVDMMFVPWSAILAIRTSPCLQSEREPLGFVKGRILTKPESVFPDGAKKRGDSGT